MRRPLRSCSPFRRNLLAMLVAGAALGLAHLNYDPVCVGASPHEKLAALAPPVMSLSVAPVVYQVPATDNDGATESAPAPIPSDPHALTGVWALKMANTMIESGIRRMAAVPDYTAQMYKQERVAGVLSEGQQIELKVRHEPFSVYMKWLSGDRGRQLIYVAGLNDGHLLVQPGGIKGRLTGVLALEPTGSMAMSESRHPVTKIGLLELAKTVAGYQRVDLEKQTGFRCQLLDGQEFEGRPCYLFACEYDSEKANADYRKSVMFIDKELSIPVCVKNYCWGRDVNPESIDEETLVEFYAYSDIQLGRELTAGDFDQHNSDYKLRVRR